MASESGEEIIPTHTACEIQGKDGTKRVSFTENTLNDIVARELRASEHDFDLAALKKALLESYEYREKYAVRKENVSPRRRLKKCFPSLLERGVPEGQEDLKRYSSSSSLSECGKDDLRYRTDSYFTNAKALLIRKFLKSIPSKRSSSRCVLPSSTECFASSRLLRVKRCDLQDFSCLTKSLADEITKHAPPTEDIALRLRLPLLKLVTGSGKYKLYKAFKVLTVEGCPVLAVITSESLSFVRYCAVTDTFAIQSSCAFANLAAAVIGPFSQLVIVLNANKEKLFVNTGLSTSAAAELISHLEVAIRRWCAATKADFNFNVAEVHDLKRMRAFHSVLPEDAFVENEIVIAQYSVWLQEDCEETTSSLGPEREGYLMTKTGLYSSWAPSYVCLKGGVLYLFEKISQRIPKFALPLRSTLFKGCRVHNYSERPHTFEIFLEGNSSFCFGAADESEMLEWIRDLQSSAAQTSKIESQDSVRDSPLINCFVTLSSNQILLHRFPNEIISRAFLHSVSSFTKSSWPNSCYCLLELSCREASERGGDWILYFVSEDSFKSFYSEFLEIADHSVTAYRVEDERFVMRKSDLIAAGIHSSWNSFFV